MRYLICSTYVLKTVLPSDIKNIAWSNRFGTKKVHNRLVHNTCWSSGFLKIFFYFSSQSCKFWKKICAKKTSPHWSTKVTCFWCKNSLSSSTTWFWKIFSSMHQRIFKIQSREKVRGEEIFLDQNSKMSLNKMSFDKLCVEAEKKKTLFLSHFLFLVSDPN